MMRIDVITPFPDMLKGIFQESILRKAQEKEIVKLVLWDLRSFAEDKHKTVDDYPYGGGPGMILKPEPIFRAVDAIRETCPDSDPKIIFMTPQGRTFAQSEAKKTFS